MMSTNSRAFKCNIPVPRTRNYISNTNDAQQPHKRFKDGIRYGRQACLAFVCFEQSPSRLWLSNKEAKAPSKISSSAELWVLVIILRTKLPFAAHTLYQSLLFASTSSPFSHLDIGTICY